MPQDVILDEYFAVKGQMHGFTDVYILNDVNTDDSRYNTAAIRVNSLDFNAPPEQSARKTSLTSFGTGLLFTDASNNTFAVQRADAPFIAIQNEGDTTGKLYEKGDVVILSEQLNRDLTDGKEYFQYTAMTKEEFAQGFARSDYTYFKPTISPRPAKQSGAFGSEPYGTQLDSIKDFKEDQFKAHYNDITTLLDDEFRSEYEAALKAAYSRGEDFERYSNIFNTVASVVAPDCIERLENDYTENSRAYRAHFVVSELFNKDGKESEMRSSLGDDVVDSLVADWAKSVAETHKGQTHSVALNVETITQALIDDKKKDLGYIFRHKTGESACLTDALSKVITPEFDSTYERLSKEGLLSGLPYIGKRMEARKKASVKKRFGLTQ